ncbi:1-acyl-sn-glycerol-3-phosphate acyltransferase [Luteolibacter flavescens]|uniref:1-acyl-sn-glycerol-3-phosphate acyltransferase n=1 Tax=Luteolibacter flavescens TaxID=1859460 RepID=A0ABT3FJ99_9BACT|nr:1-acyl-sn-glycerol-3-phosphate acyltransferase [Luteolibacter flavescens]MCW1883625.1 1-acyl-sn-glycerol-3-phosphate acyltransferase [Luteolibacter flavescens]
MRRLRNDLPYTFRPPRPRAWFRPIGLMANRYYLQKKFAVTKLDDSGFDRVRELSRAGHAVLLAPNHADHSDPHVMTELVARHGMKSHFMAAREVFEISKLGSFALESMGVFSVDRDGPDLSAIKTAITLLESSSDPLVIYPEGEIYHHHERLDPLHEGVASILLKAAARLKDGKEAYLVPVGIRFLHDPLVEETFRDRLSRLEDRIGWTPRPALPIDERIVRLGTGLLGLKEMEHTGEAGRGQIQDRLATLCDALLTIAEARHGRDPKSATAPERVRAQRYRIRKRLLDAEKPPTFVERDELLDDLDRVFTALQAHSYIGDYFLAEQTLDRRAETIMKLEEDLLGFPNYPSPRTARVTAGEPIPVSSMLAAGELPAKGGAGQLTGLLEERLSALLG